MSHLSIHLQTLTNEISILPCQQDVIPFASEQNEAMRPVLNHILIHVERAAQAPQWRQ